MYYFLFSFSKGEGLVRHIGIYELSISYSFELETNQTWKNIREKTRGGWERLFQETQDTVHVREYISKSYKKNGKRTNTPWLIERVETLQNLSLNFSQ